VQLLGEAIFCVFWLFLIVENLQLWFGLIILGEVENLQFVYVMNACGKFYFVHVKDYEIACLNPRRET
jgi:hypothetical protein